ncbi:uncharacterized protein LOC123713035 [Pieris brassicae]|uniref:uncharacterized protein LOC123713035 n=1 Tax=Pieris brassicae TaxID=7116 RepID=UPI001E662961|nr:uncharacterized protein LOC123713035 [Pieris brassicae]XP_045522471.1 uncharacterized protein LOC123713035 [Pieris brassicae]
MFWRTVLLGAFVTSVSGHGRVLRPPGRASMWRVGFNSPPNYDDDGLNCGGFDRQYRTNRGKCGVCGDAYDMRPPRTHELGGTYGKGTVVGTYRSGQILEVTVEITAFHKGYWYFKICPDPKRETQRCFDKYPLHLEDGGVHYYPTKGGKHRTRYRLPNGLSCDHCVLQWRYVAGNNWGRCDNGTEGVGCGNQETFGACSDISISPFRYLDAESIPLDIKSAEGLFKLLQKANVAPFTTKPKKKPNKKKNRRQPRKRNKRKRKKVESMDSWFSNWI